MGNKGNGSEANNSRAAGYLLQWLMFRPALMRSLLARIAKDRKVFRHLGRVLVVGYPEVREVLERKHQFHLADAMAGRIASGEFLLNLEPPGLYDTDKSQLAKGFLAAPFLTSVMQLSQSESQRIINATGHGGHLDVVGDLLEPVAGQVVLECFLGAAKRDGQSQRVTPEELEHFRNLSKLIVATNPNAKSVTRLAEKAKKLVYELIHERLDEISGGASGTDAVALMHAHGFAPKDITRNICGMASAGMATVSRAGGQAVDSLLNQPESIRNAARQAACHALQSGKKAVVVNIMFEALRFNPLFPFALRHCVERTSLEPSQGDTVEVKAGESLSLGLMAAMFDPRAFPEPDQFRFDRPLDSYLHFGFGIHRCFGAPLAELEFQEVFTELLQHSLSRRSPLIYDPQQALRHLEVTLS